MMFQIGDKVLYEGKEYFISRHAGGITTSQGAKEKFDLVHPSGFPITGVLETQLEKVERE